MDDVSLNAANRSLKINQIASLEHEETNLYGEVIQIVPRRKLCWFRPLCLVIPNSIEADDRSPRESFSDSWGVTLPPESGTTLFAQQTTKRFPQNTSPYFPPQENRLINLQFGSDLLWPAILFRPALDTEVIHFLAQLQEANQTSIDSTLNKKYFNTFIHQVWQAHQDKF